MPDGAILGSTPPRPAADVYVYFSVSEDDWPVAAEVLHSGGVSGSIAGLLQIQVRVPRGVHPSAATPVSLGVRSENGIFGSQLVTVAVKYSTQSFSM